MKSCVKCGELKAFELFPKHSKTLDGYNSWCKKCVNRASEIYKRKNVEANKARLRAKYARQMKRLHGEHYVIGDPKNNVGGKPAVLTPEQVKQRHNTRRVTRRAIKSGKLIRQPCIMCGEIEVDAHHPDYSKPLDVVWVCKKHHHEIHYG